MQETKPSFAKRAKTLIIGGARNPEDKHLFHKLSLIAFFAWIGLGADGLSSSCYGPEEAFLVLGQHYYLGIFVALITVVTIFIIAASYFQVIELFPSGGGGYLVASKLLSPGWGMLSGAALLVDYVLTISLSIASGADALFSFLPQAFLAYKLEFTIGGLLLLIILNLRGVKESVAPLVPIFLIFIFTHAFIIIFAPATHVWEYQEVFRNTASDISAVSSEIGLVGIFLLIMRSYSMGAGTYTGIEAVSNGLPILREPRVETAKRTMRYMTASLALLVLGLVFAYILYRVTPQYGKTLNAVLLERMTAGWGGWGRGFVFVTLFSEAALLFVAAQTGFFGGPRVLANMAADRWVPTKFGSLSDRFVIQNGILIMGGAALATLVLSGGSVHLLVVLYSINVFITFSLSQLGMLRHWWQSRDKDVSWRRPLFVNVIGLSMTLFILVSVTVLKFNEGGWITILVTGSLVGIVLLIKRHYRGTARLLKRLDGLVEAAQTSTSAYLDSGGKKKQPHIPDLSAKTAVILVNGFNGLGLHTLFAVIRLFKDTFKNFVFIQIGALDAGNFKGTEELQNLKAYVETEVGKYVQYMNRHGFHAEAFTAIGVDVVEEVEKMTPRIIERFPNAIFFGGQLVFPKESFITRLLHNYTVFAVQRNLYRIGIPVVIMPIRV
jgi:amino acid transporter